MYIDPNSLGMERQFHNHVGTQTFYSAAPAPLSCKVSFIAHIVAVAPAIMSIRSTF